MLPREENLRLALCRLDESLRVDGSEEMPRPTPNQMFSGAQLLGLLPCRLVTPEPLFTWGMKPHHGTGVDR